MADRTGRRTQAERRATTRAALLDAALECLVEEGYGNLSTRRVAERAGLSQGTQMHYFPTRAQFVAEAVRHMTFRLLAELREPEMLAGRTERRRLEALLDRVWELHNGPLLEATMELWIAARTDEEVRVAMGGVARDVTRLIGRSAAELFPALMARPGAGEALELTLAAIRGLALLRATAEPREIERRWRRIRPQLLGLFEPLSD